MIYRVQVKTATGQFINHDVAATTGDEAAEAGVRAFPGGYVAAVNPAPAEVQPHLQAKAKAA